MWDKKESGTQRTQQPPTTPRAEPEQAAAQAASGPGTKGRAANIGGSLFIKGEVTGSEDLTVEGRVEGKIDLKDHNLSIAKNGRVNAEIHARSVTIHGEVSGNVHADEKVEIAETGRAVGDLFAPRVAISDGAQFQGSVDMSGTKSAGSAASVKESARVHVASREGQARGGSSARQEAAVALRERRRDGLNRSRGRGPRSDPDDPADSTMMLWKGTRGEAGPAPAPAPAPEGAEPCVVLEQFFRRVIQVQVSPYVLMLGEVCGSNVSFLGERGFRVCMDKDVGRKPDGTYAGALLWDALSLMTHEEARRRTSLLHDLLEAGGAVVALFDSPSSAAASPLKRYRILSESRIVSEPVPGRKVKRHPYQNGEIVRLFDGFEVELLQMRRSGRRDALFHKAWSG